MREAKQPDGYVLSKEIFEVELVYEDQEIPVVYADESLACLFIHRHGDDRIFLAYLPVFKVHAICDHRLFARVGSLRP